MRIGGQFIGEPIQIVVDTVSANALAGGGPACPQAFVWRNHEYRVTRVLDRGRRLSHDGYVRQHRFRVETNDGTVAVLACDRQLRRGANPWQLLALESSGSSSMTRSGAASGADPSSATPGAAPTTGSSAAPGEDPASGSDRASASDTTIGG